MIWSTPAHFTTFEAFSTANNSVSNAWNSSLNVFNISINNWILILFAVIAGSLKIMESYGLIEKAERFSRIILIYGILQLFLYGGLTIHSQSLGIGCILTLISYMILLAVPVRGSINNKL
jgi:hypothetical protein